MRMFRNFTIALVAAVLGLAGSAAPAAADCLSSGQARLAVQNGQALPLQAVAARLGGELLNAQLCQNNGQLVYRVSVYMKNGQVVIRIVDARTGRVLN